MSRKQDHRGAASSKEPSLVLRLVHPAESGGGVPSFLSLDKLPFSIGRRPNPVKKDQSSIKLSPSSKILSGMMSRTHAVFSKTKKGLVVEDASSSHGLYVNKQKREKAVNLSVGDTISFGRRVLDSKEILGVTYVVQSSEGEGQANKEASDSSRGGGDGVAKASGSSNGRSAKRPRIEPIEEQGGGFEEETVAVVKGEDLRCSLCLDPIATACHLTCGHNYCFICTHKHFFHKAISESRAWGFEAVYECPSDRKTVHSVSRCLRTDQHTAALVASSKRLSDEEKEAWEKRRKEGLRIAEYYERELQGDPSNLPGTCDKVMLEVKLSDVRSRRSTCRGCLGNLAKDELAVMVQASQWKIEGQQTQTQEFGTGNKTYCHAKCVTPTVLKKVEVLRKPERFCYVELRLVAEDDWTEEKKDQAKEQLKDGIRDQDPDNIPWWLHETEARTVKMYRQHNHHHHHHPHVHPYQMALAEAYPGEAQFREHFLRYITGIRLAAPPVVHAEAWPPSGDDDDDEDDYDDEEEEEDDEDIVLEEEDDEDEEEIEVHGEIGEEGSMSAEFPSDEDDWDWEEEDGDY